MRRQQPIGGGRTDKWDREADAQRHLERIERLARLMDEAFEIPGTRYRVGFDGIIGLVPLVGDAVSLGTNAYVIYVADRLGVSRWTLAKMLANAGVDFAFGSIPLLGDLFDVAFKSHRRNVSLLRRALDRRTTVTASRVRAAAAPTRARGRLPRRAASGG